MSNIYKTLWRHKIEEPDFRNRLITLVFYVLLLKVKGASIRQISRLTGVSRGIVEHV